MGSRKWLLGPRHKPWTNLPQRGQGEWNNVTCASAALGGHLEVLLNGLVKMVVHGITGQLVEPPKKDI